MKNSFSTKNYKNKIFFTSDTQQKKYKIIREYLPSLNQKNILPLKINTTKEGLIKKEMDILDQIWDELEIVFPYREAFYLYVNNMNDEYRNNIIIQEKNNLKKYKKTLINLQKEIGIREDNILLLKRYNNRLENFNNYEQISNIIDEVTNIVKKLRKNAINIIKEYSKIESISKNYSNLDKITKKIIKSEYTYDPNYLFKMQDDLLFLKESTFSKYFEMDNKFIDPFLTNFCTESTGNNKKCISNTNDIMGLINESRYILFQNKIFDKMKDYPFKNLTINKDINIETPCLKTLSRNFSTKTNRKIENKKNSDKKDNKIDIYLNRLKANSPSQYSKLFMLKKTNLLGFYNSKKHIHISYKEIKPNTNTTNTGLSQKIKLEITEPKNRIKNINQNITVNYYTGDINTLLKTVEDKIPLYRIPQIFKNAFQLNNSIYKKEYYVKGIFPKILVLTKDDEKNKNNIIGLCSFYYEWKDDPRYLKLNINHIITNCSINYEQIISKVINFIKTKVKCDRIEIILVNNELGKPMLNYFKNELKFNWSKVEKSKNNLFESLYYEKKEINDLTDIFILKNKSILCTSKNKLTRNGDNQNDDGKYINKNNIYYMLLEDKNIKIECENGSKLKEITNQKETISKISKIETNYQIKEDNDIKKYLDENSLKQINDNGIIHKINLNLNFENCYSVILNEIYYNKLSTEKMKIFQEDKTKTIFYLIPSQDSSFSFNICEINQELKNLLFNNNSHQNIYEIFLDLNTNSKINILEKNPKSLYIPSFILNKHLYSDDFENMESNIKISDIEPKSPLYLSSLNEFINVEFKPDINIKNNFIDNELNKGYVIKDEFIIGIFNNDLIKDNKFTLVQLLHIKKENFITKNNNKE